MPFDNLKKKLGYSDDQYLQAPINIPGTEGLDQSASQQAFLGAMLNKTLGVGDDVKTTDSIEPVSSPIDTLGYLAGGSLGGALARDAGQVVGNEAGAINFGKGVIDKTNQTPPIGKVFREENVPTRSNYGKVVIPEEDPNIQKLLNLLRGYK